MVLTLPDTIAMEPEELASAISSPMTQAAAAVPAAAIHDAETLPPAVNTDKADRKAIKTAAKRKEKERVHAEARAAAQEVKLEAEKEAKAAARALKKTNSRKRKAAMLNADPADVLDMEILGSLDSQLAPAVTPTAITATAPAAIAAGDAAITPTAPAAILAEPIYVAASASPTAAAGDAANMGDEYLASLESPFLASTPAPAAPAVTTPPVAALPVAAPATPLPCGHSTDNPTMDCDVCLQYVEHGHPSFDLPAELAIQMAAAALVYPFPTPPLAAAAQDVTPASDADNEQLANAPAAAAAKGGVGNG
jgi:hypothetical protein